MYMSVTINWNKFDLIFLQVENVLYMVTELLISKKLEEEGWEEMRNTTTDVATLMVSKTLH